MSARSNHKGKWKGNLNQHIITPKSTVTYITISLHNIRNNFIFFPSILQGQVSIDHYFTLFRFIRIWRI